MEIESFGVDFLDDRYVLSGYGIGYGFSNGGGSIYGFCAVERLNFGPAYLIETLSYIKEYIIEDSCGDGLGNGIT